MKIWSWQGLETHIEFAFNFKKTIASGAVFNNCDLVRKFKERTITLEAKYQNIISDNLKFKKDDFYKAKNQCKPNNILVLAYGNIEHILFFINASSELLRDFKFPVKEIYDRSKNYQFSVDFASCNTYILDEINSVISLPYDNFREFIRLLETEDKELDEFDNVNPQKIII